MNKLNKIAIILALFSCACSAFSLYYNSLTACEPTDSQVEMNELLHGDRPMIFEERLVEKRPI